MLTGPGQEAIAEILTEDLSDDDLAMAAFNSGLDAESDGKAAVAILCFRNAVNKLPRQSLLRIALGRMLLLSKSQFDRKNGAQELEAAVRLGENSFHVFRALAAYYNRQGDKARVAEQYERALKSRELQIRGGWIEVEVARLGMMLIGYYRQQGKPAEAARVCGILTRRFPQRVEMRLRFAGLLLEAGQFNAARQQVAAFEKVVPLNPDGASLLARHLKKMGKYPQALLEVDRALRIQTRGLSPIRARSRNLSLLRSEILTELGHYQQAGRELKMLLAVASENHQKVAALIGLARLDRAQGQSPEAITRLRGALASGIKSGLLHREIAICQRQIGQIKDAMRAVGRALEIDTKDVQSYLLLARLLEADGQLLAAAVQLRMALVHQANHGPVAAMLARLYCSKGIDDKEAMRLIRIARNRHPEKVAYMLTEGQLLIRQGKAAAALILLKTLQKQKLNAVNNQLLGDLFFALGYFRQSRATWELSRQQQPGNGQVLMRLQRLKKSSGGN